MANLQHFQAKVCYTAAGVLIVEGKVLLIKHKKLGLWLNPGGHIEPNELPHQAAEREFFEETGIRVKAVDVVGLYDETTTEFLPNPISTNLHWISKENYWGRLQDKESTDKTWSNGCEQHVNFLFLVQPVAGVDLQFNAEETLGINWFSAEELETAEIADNIRQEIAHSFRAVDHLEKMKSVM
ncbi:NUDIX domain-containing protein [Patescibacteria group bacterium]|nr:NUDIX domain-containing protein [Patescibacteria group bacterium]